MYVVYENMGESSHVVALCETRERAEEIIVYLLRTRDWTERKDYDIFEYPVNRVIGED